MENKHWEAMPHFRKAVNLWRKERKTAKDKRYLDKAKRTTDPWDKEFVIKCIDGDDPEVYSLGPDNQEGGCDPGRASEDGCDEED